MLHIKREQGGHPKITIEQVHQIVKAPTMSDVEL